MERQAKPIFFRLDPRLTAVALGLLSLGWAILTFYLLTDPEPPGSGLSSGEGSLPQWVLPTVGHFGLFGGLSVLLFTPLMASTPLTRRPVLAAIGVALVATIYGGGLELYQSTLPTRYASWEDGMVNFAGAISGVVLVLLALRINRARGH